MKKLAFILALLITNVLFANVILPSVFSDHMVLQQQDNVKFWGWANPNEDVMISPSWTNENYKTKANNQAYWELTVKTPKYGGPFSISIKGYNEIVLNDILVGEVWLCSGQSNMEMSASWGIDNGEQAIAEANYSNIRFFNVPKISADTPQNNVIAQWQVCSPESMKYTSAVAYYFSKKLQKNLKNVPIGLIISAWGGTPAEIWMPENIINNDSILLQAANKLMPAEYGPTKPGKAYNAMVHPVIGYNIAGTLWYQGESNVGASTYDKTLSALIKSWRALWRKEFPFYFVQIAPYNYGKNHFGGVEIRDAQRRVSNKNANTEMIVISDISPIDDIHPKDKKSVGNRLAHMALKKHYKVINDLVESPNFDTVHFEKSKAIISFKYAEGLYSKDTNSLFEIAGADNVFHPATFILSDTKAIITSKTVKNPKNIRFAWGNNVQSNIFNKANLPVSSFTTNN